MPDGIQSPHLLAPAGRSHSIRLVEDVDGLTGHPVGRPSWVLWMAFGPVAVGLIAAAVYERDDLLALPAVTLVAVVALVALMFAIIVAGFVAFYEWQNQRMTAPGPFFHADAAGRWLALPRSGVRIDRADILGFTELRAWHTVRDSEGSSSDWLGEVSVLVRGPGEEVGRHLVVTAERADVVSRIGRRLAEVFGVECRRSR